MKIVPLIFLLIVEECLSTPTINLRFRRVRSDGTGELSRTPEGFVQSPDSKCYKGRYLYRPQAELGRLSDPVPMVGQPMSLILPRPLQYSTGDYCVYDNFRRRSLEFFDPEEYVCCNPNVAFPPELDIPAGWAIYNPVTAQAPLPTIIRDLAETKYTGYYYACPNYVNPFDYSWYFNSNSATSPCKWIWYQSHRDAGAEVFSPAVTQPQLQYNKPLVTKFNG